MNIRPINPPLDAVACIAHAKAVRYAQTARVKALTAKRPFNPTSLLEFMQSHDGACSTAEIAARFGVSVSQVYHRLNQLRQTHVITTAWQGDAKRYTLSGLVRP